MGIVGDVDIHIQKWDRRNHRDEKSGDLKKWDLHLHVAKCAFVFGLAMNDNVSNG